MKSSAGRFWKIKRNDRLPRHSKRFWPNLRIPRPLCTWGWPNPSARSQRADKHSTLSLLGRSRSLFRTAGSIERTLAEHFPELFRSHRHKFFIAFLPSIPLLGSLGHNRNLPGGHTILALGVIGRLHIDFSKRNNIGAADNADVLSPGRSGKPVTQILLRICNRESLHKDFITPINKSVHCPEGSKASPTYPYLFAVECCFEPLVYSHISVPRRAFST